jgi:glyoxylase-like metal-dependent hydrolase (beta-lactamase superfamily II)
MPNPSQITRFDSSSGARIYQIPMTVFPNGFVAYSYLILNQGEPTLVDCGSGFGDSTEDLLKGIDALKSEFGESLTVRDIGRIFITHGHIDHFGGVADMVEHTGGAIVGVHELDRRVLVNYEERVAVAAKDLRVYLERAGIRPEKRQTLMNMYQFAKKHVRSVEVGITLDEDVTIDGMTFYHAPGHCSGQVMIQLGDVLLVADHILSKTSPHQAPESITAYTGLGHYRDSLRRATKINGIRLALAGHEDPIIDLHGRISQIQASHERKLNRIIDLIRDSGQPMTISDISRTMYPDKHGYDVLLAIEEAGAHIEYLYQHGALSVHNLTELEHEENPALQYVLA